MTRRVAGRMALAMSSGSTKPEPLKGDRKSTRLNSSHTEIYTISLHDALPIYRADHVGAMIQDDETGRGPDGAGNVVRFDEAGAVEGRSEEHTSELQSHRDLHYFPTRRSSDLSCRSRWSHDSG